MEAKSLPVICAIAAAAMLSLAACESFEREPGEAPVRAVASERVAATAIVDPGKPGQPRAAQLEADGKHAPGPVPGQGANVARGSDTGPGLDRPGSDGVWHCAGQSVEGRSIAYAKYGQGEQVILILASIHGNEPAGTPLTEALIERLEAGPAWLEGRQVLVMPRANPDGVSKRSRLNSRGVDLNRNFPSANWDPKGRHGLEPLCEPESRAIADLIQTAQVTRIISIHQPVNLLDYDGPAEALAEAMGAVGPLRVHRMGARPGSLGSWAGLDRGIPIVTVELPGRAGNIPQSELWATFGPMLIAGISH